jgi:hypothetical protein
MTDRIRIPFSIAHKLVCEEHREYGVVCPFPGCTNGVEADEFVMDKPLAGEEVFRRVAWTDHEGNTSYSWKGDLPLWFSLPRVFWREADRLGIVPPSDDTSPTLYQYTTPGGFLGMITSSELWLTDYGYLNDASELRHGLSLARDGFAAAADRRPEAEKVLKAWGNAKLERHRVCIASFSRDGDSLSQWRGYGNVAVGFCTDYPGFGYSNTSVTRSVIYDQDIQKLLLDLMAHLTASAWEGDREDIPDKVDELYGDGSDRILDVVAFFKDPHFVDEREVRLVHLENADVMSRMGLPLSPRRFRTIGQTIVPYLTTRDVSSPCPERLPIREVVVGPSATADTLARGIREALDEHGYLAVPVKRSETPFRG